MIGRGGQGWPGGRVALLHTWREADRSVAVNQRHPDVAGLVILGFFRRIANAHVDDL